MAKKYTPKENARYREYLADRLQTFMPGARKAPRAEISDILERTASLARQADAISAASGGESAKPSDENNDPVNHSTSVVRISYGYGGREEASRLYWAAVKSGEIDLPHSCGGGGTCFAKFCRDHLKLATEPVEETTPSHLEEVGRCYGPDTAMQLMLEGHVSSSVEPI